jgi:hypothetical protein
VIYSHGSSALEKYNVATGTLTTITSSAGVVFFDIGTTPDGNLYGSVSGSGTIRLIDKTNGSSVVVGTVTTPGNTNFNMLAFDKYGKGWFVGAGGTQLLSFDLTSVSGGTITPTVVVSNLQTAGFPTGSSAGDVFFLNGDMYIAWASSGTIKLMKLDMTDTGTGYTSTGAAGTASDLGTINAANVWGMAVADGKIYVANGSKISRLNSLPSTADSTRTLNVTDIVNGTVGVIYGMTAEGEAVVDNCLGLAPTFTQTSAPSSTAGQPLNFNLGVKSFGDSNLTITSGQLPPGVVLDNTNKSLTGTPTAGGTYTFAVTATESDGDTTTQVYTLTIGASSSSSSTSTTTAPTTTIAISTESELPKSGSALSQLALLSMLMIAVGLLTLRRRHPNL